MDSCHNRIKEGKNQSVRFNVESKLNPGFSITGNIYLNGTFSGGSESNKIVIEAGRQ
jgi:hypothetical protein